MMQDPYPDEAMLQNALTKLQDGLFTSENIDWTSLEHVASIRFALSNVAVWMQRLYIRKENTGNNRKVKQLCEAARQVCDQYQYKWPRY